MEVEYFPTREGESPSDWIRDQLARGYIVVQVYGVNADGVMMRSMMTVHRTAALDINFAGMAAGECVFKMAKAGGRPAARIGDQ